MSLISLDSNYNDMQFQSYVNGTYYLHPYPCSDSGCDCTYNYPEHFGALQKSKSIFYSNIIKLKGSIAVKMAPGGGFTKDLENSYIIKTY